MATPYVYERQSEYWTSRQIEEFFLDNGFEIITIPLLQIHERDLPADFIYYDKGLLKIFGFQYKALYRNKKDYWPIDQRQHQELRKFPWIYYCLSELRDYRDIRAALHMVRIVNSNFEYRPNIYPFGEDRLEIYSRWGAFYQGLTLCRNGIKVQSTEEIYHALIPENDKELAFRLSSMLVDVFINNIETRKSIHLSPLIRGTNLG